MQPLRAKGWDKALAEFTAATLTNAESESKPSMSKRLNEISCPGTCTNSTSSLPKLFNSGKLLILKNIY
jgi:hypothetical protein